MHINKTCYPFNKNVSCGYSQNAPIFQHNDVFNKMLRNKKKKPYLGFSHNLHAQFCKMTSSEKMQKHQREKVVKIRIENVKTPRLSHMKNESFNGNGMRREGTGTSNKSKEIKF